VVAFGAFDVRGIVRHYDRARRFGKIVAGSWLPCPRVTMPVTPTTEDELL
jgi:hypothetical protein